MKRLVLLFLPLALAGCDKLVEAIKPSDGDDSAVETLSLHTTQLSEGEIDAFVGRQNQVVVVDFYADWCGPCRTLAPKLDRIANEFGPKVALGKVNVDNANAAAARFGVSGIPDVRIYVNGREVDRFVGDMSESLIRAKIEPHTASVSGEPGEAAPTAPGSEETGIQPMQKDWLPPGMERQ